MDKYHNEGKLRLRRKFWCAFCYREKAALDRECSKWQAETSELRLRLEDMRASRQEAVKELVALRAQHQKEVQTLQLEMLDEASTRECIDRR